MKERNQQNNVDSQSDAAQNRPFDEFDVAGKYLSDALRISFAVLKLIMLVLVIIFLASGLTSIESDEQALVLRLGKIRGVGEDRIIGPGFKLLLPYPVDEIVRIPVAKKLNLPIDSFWFFQKPHELLPEGPDTRVRIPDALDPIKDGYCITRSAAEAPLLPGSAGSDYNIVHAKWQLVYQIDDPERFFKNVYVGEPKPGQSYADVIDKSITPLLKNLAEDAVVTAMVHYTIDEAISSQDRITRHVERLLQQELAEIESGIKVISVQLTDVTWPRQVNAAFLASIRASQESQKRISEAKGYAENTLNETAGAGAEKLLAVLKDPNVNAQEKELLWDRLAGKAQEIIADARAYRTKVVEAARANAEYLQQILPEYRKRPELVVQEIYQDAIEHVLNNADEKIIIEPGKGNKTREIRIQLNRDPTLKPKIEQKEQK
jgi:membrane protease subunit HflK